MSAPDLILLHEQDNVATALRDLDVGRAARISGPAGAMGTVLLRAAIRLGHKVALADFESGELVFKHGQPFGKTTSHVASGEHVHVHNVVSLSAFDANGSDKARGTEE